jgi:hypothetical protein
LNAAIRASLILLMPERYEQEHETLITLVVMTGPGRAGKFGELITEKGSRYEGEVLAGRPHGHGKYFVSKVRSCL